MDNVINIDDALRACLELIDHRRKWDTHEGRAEIRGIDAVMCELYNLAERKKGEENDN